MDKNTPRPWKRIPVEVDAANQATIKALVEALERLTYQNLSFFRGCVGEGQISYADIQFARAALEKAKQ